jgi:RimJ/RimL family protein N-acetyltransferase
MSAETVEIRRLAHESTADVSRYRDIRLEALQASPESFGSTFDFEDTQALSWFSDRLGSSTVLGAFGDGQLVGVASFALQRGQKQAHKGTLWGMYVRPTARSAGVGRRLVDAVCTLARHQVELIQLTVVLDNEQARRLYARLGFLEYGIERRALKQAGRYYDQVLMAKDLSE